MTEESSSNISDRVLSLEENLNRFIDFSMQLHRDQDRRQRDHEVQLRSQQEQINSLTTLTRQVAEAQLVLMQNQNEILTRFDQMQSEILGLRTETQRILDLMLNEPPEEEDVN